LNQEREEELRICDSHSSAFLWESWPVEEEGEVQEWVLLEQPLEDLDVRICQRRPMEEGHQTWVEEVTALVQTQHPSPEIQLCPTVSGLEEVGGRLFSEPGALEDRLTAVDHRAAVAAEALESLFLHCRSQLALARVLSLLEVVAVSNEADWPSVVLLSGSRQ
jgi:hypothetical protein